MVRRRSIRETLTTENAETTGIAALSVEIDAFVVVDGAGNRFTAEVQVAVDGQNRSRVLSGPSLTPLSVPGPGRPHTVRTPRLDQ